MAIEVKNDTIQIERYELGPFGTNSYIITCLKTGDSVVVDAPGDAPKVLGHVQQTNPKYMDYRGYFWISTEETSSWEWLDYYSTALVCGSEKLREILDKADLYFEWENPAIAGVYDA